MNSTQSDKKYIVYKHTTPNGKVYIGITCKAPNDRWASGFGYEHQVYFFRAIVKYGWINIKHEILFEGLTKKEAENKEVELIAEYKAADLTYGYNIDLGGDLHRLSVETRKKISEVKIGRKWSERQRLASIEHFEKNPGKKVYKYDLQGNLLQVFPSCKIACKDSGVTYKTFQWYMCTKKFPAKWIYIYSYGSFADVMKKTHRDAYNSKPVDMYDLSLNFIRAFRSIEDAKRYLRKQGLGNGSKIWQVCNGIGQTSNNYIWRYHNENTDYKSA